jgi:hypothetical protein
VSPAFVRGSAATSFCLPAVPHPSQGRNYTAVVGVGVTISHRLDVAARTRSPSIEVRSAARWVTRLSLEAIPTPGLLPCNGGWTPARCGAATHSLVTADVAVPGFQGTRSHLLPIEGNYDRDNHISTTRFAWWVGKDVDSV